MIRRRQVTYRQVWARARASVRRGGYERSAAGWLDALSDLVEATSWLIRPAMMLAVLGYGQPQLVSPIDGTEVSR
jgi:hypothetical protein